jgi:hypothetical protein
LPINYTPHLATVTVGLFQAFGLFLHWIDPLNRRPSTVNAAGTFVLVHGAEALVLDAQRGESFIG